MLSTLSAIQSKPLTPFDNIEFRDARNLKVIVDPNAENLYTLTFEGSPEDIESFVYTSENGTLIVKNKENRGKWRSRSLPVDVKIVVKHLEKISVGDCGNISVTGLNEPKLDGFFGGASNIFISGTIKQLFLSLGGNGDLHLSQVVSDNIKVNLAGSGSTRISGTTKILDINAVGSGGINAQQLTVRENAEFSMVGSGGTKVCVKGQLDSSIVASGSVQNTCKPNKNR